MSASSSPRPSFRPTSLLALSIALFAIACSGRVASPSESTGAGLSSSGGSSSTNVCSGKVCGQDCSPPGSDEPFNCNASGACVAVGTDLKCGGKPAPAAAPECAGKVCGQDCSPPGSDEPFNCNSAGKCVGAGSSLGCEEAPSPACYQKACGADCTPEGSDEPFNCTKTGHCVAAGQPLDCKKCPEFLGDCMKGYVPADLDGDGCIDGCKPAP